MIRKYYGQRLRSIKIDLQIASFSDLDQISTIEKETNEYPWSPNNFKSSLDAGNSSIVLKDKKNILGYADWPFEFIDQCRT